MLLMLELPLDPEMSVAYGKNVVSEKLYASSTVLFLRRKLGMSQLEEVSKIFTVSC